MLGINIEINKNQSIKYHFSFWIFFLKKMWCVSSVVDSNRTQDPEYEDYMRDRNAEMMMAMK
jgi:hypothetical protein